ncbi:hypothetical protein LUZ61_009855 [Rhynchospora tenuis]|uniref:C3H1-type domain-containing protein n=1 Tax=Rhynchospora tenuis TaxID=198213 RepID=A0AAD6EYZ6_9POAL|nr:hypothetical protein LUZ61_009855 [Rhynchospora tenuis]
METTPAAPCEEPRPSDLQSTAPSHPDKVATGEHNSGDEPRQPDSVQNTTANTNQPMETDPVPPTEQIQPSNPEPTAVINSEKRKREEEHTSDPESKKQNSNLNSSSNPLWKTSLCSYYRRYGANCSHGETCRYAHGEEELRPRPDNTWDPTSNKAKEMQKADEMEKDDEEEEEEPVALDESSLDKCLVGLPRKWVHDALKKFLEEKGISYKTAKKKKGMEVGFVTFENVEQVESAMEILKESSSGGKTIKLRDAIKRSFENKYRARERGSADNIEGDGGLVEGMNSSTRKSVREVVTPLAHLSYSDQLEHKKSSLSQLLKKLTRNARKACPDALPLPDWILESREIGGLPCKLEGILESPLTNGYRNKCEFSVGYSLDGNITVGFMLGNFREGVTAVEEPTDCPNVSKLACTYAMIFQNFLGSSELPVWNRINNTGFWRQLAVREGRNPDQGINAESEMQIKELMLMIQVCSSGVEEEVMKAEFEKMRMAFSQGANDASPSLPLTTIVVQDHTGISNAAPADCPLIPLLVAGGGTDGSDCLSIDKANIHDYISNLCFSISPTAFFQVNTLAAERLYKLAGDWAELSEDTLLFDVCCGTGTIGLTLAHRVGMVVGIEMNESAVSDAQRNAIINGITNCKFICAKAEDVMGSLLKEYLGAPTDASSKVISNSNGHSKKSEEVLEDTKNSTIVKLEAPDEQESNRVQKKDIIDSSEKTENFSGTDAGLTVSDGKEKQHRFKNVVAIVDPPRVGLHPTVIKALRTHPGIRRLVYISCNPDSLVANAIELCTPTSDKPEKNKGNKGWRNMSSAGLARHRTKSMPNSEHFRPVRSMAVDLFPHTNHCEMVMLFQR